jgi:hypothetical protein
MFSLIQIPEVAGGAIGFCLGCAFMLFMIAAIHGVCGP